jgi:hypothetical protein
MMHGYEKSDPAIVVMKPANKAEGPSAARPAEEKHAAEPVERRAGTKGNADQQSTHRTQRRHRVAQADSGLYGRGPAVPRVVTAIERASLSISATGKETSISLPVAQSVFPCRSCRYRGQVDHRGQGTKGMFAAADSVGMGYKRIIDNCRPRLTTSHRTTPTRSGAFRSA